MLNACSGELIGCNMIRLTALLCGGIFLVLLIEGEDKGQVRQGLMTPPETAAAPPLVARAPRIAVSNPLPDVTEAVFVPVQPVRVATPVPEPVVEEPEVAQAPADRFAVVTARTANVRSGPSTQDEVIGQLSRGEQVLVVVGDSEFEGWSLVRIEGDGINGYVATRLLEPLAP